MATNKYFNPMSNSNTQAFIEKMIIQSIQANGLDMLYIPRQVIEDDEVYLEARQELFQHAYELEFVVEDIMNFNGEGHNFFAGFEMRDSVTLVVSKKRFTEVTSMARPTDLDLVYIKEADMTFQLDKIYEDETWREWGQNYVWRMKFTRFRFGHEEFETGTDVDELEGLVDEPSLGVDFQADADILEQLVNEILPSSLDDSDSYTPVVQEPYRQEPDSGDKSEEIMSQPSINIEFGE